MATPTPTRILLGALTVAIGITAMQPTAGADETPIQAPATTTTVPEPTAPLPHIDEPVADLVEWVGDRFAAVGLELPEVDVYAVGPTDEHNAAAHYVGYVGGGGEIRIFMDGDAQEIARRRVLLHEFSHAWVDEHVDEATRTAFMELRNVTEWRNDRWHRQGFEHAAEVMAWGLMDVELPVVTVLPNDTTSLSAAFSLLTGVDPMDWN